MKKRISGLLVLIACGLLVLGPAIVFAGGAKESGKAAAPAKKIIMNVASTFPPNSPQDQGLVKFKQLVEQRSGGKMEVLIHPSNAMGDERQTFEMLAAGSVEFGAVGTNDISTFFPKYAIAEVPYIFSSVDQFWKYWAGPGKELSALIEKEKNVRTVGVILRGARYTTANKPIKSVADVKGLKIRLPGRWSGRPTAPCPPRSPSAKSTWLSRPVPLKPRRTRPRPS
jgi:TRAP-type C4-dicarboxylate transport system substrate-binding protein